MFVHFFRSVLALCLPSPTSTPLYHSLHTLPLLPWAGVRTGIDLHAVYGALHRNTSLLLAHASLPLCFSLYLCLSFPFIFSHSSLPPSLFLTSSYTVRRLSPIFVLSTTLYFVPLLLSLGMHGKTTKGVNTTEKGFLIIIIVTGLDPP